MQNIRLLLVDDETSFLNTIAKRMKKRGINPELATSGEQCLSILENQPIDVVVSDVKMPGMDGIYLLKQIKEKYSDTEVILLTGQASTQDGVEGIKTGAFDYLTKPIELEHLLGKIQQAFDKILYKHDKKREAEYRARLEQQMIVTERLASIGTLATGVAHEINNPLAIIKEAAGYMGQLLKKKEAEDFAFKKQFELGISKVETGIDRARRITHKLLGFVKKNESVFSDVDVNELLNEVFELLKREALFKDIQMVPDTGDVSFIIRTDPYQLRQVLLNLVANAIHATGAHGTIKVSLKQDCDNDNMVVIMVMDTGEGIAKENLKKIFDPFFSTKNPGQGTGLGLFVSNNIMRKLGGTIEVESRLGQGTTFFVKIPKQLNIEMAEADPNYLENFENQQNDTKIKI
jgi:two-component system, NtrC family, sensor kinase